MPAGRLASTAALAGHHPFRADSELILRRLQPGRFQTVCRFDAHVEHGHGLREYCGGWFIRQ